MTRNLALFLFGTFCLLCAVACTPADPSPEKAVGVEVVLDASNMPRILDARVLILPTGERVLVMTGHDGLATCCLLPPLAQPSLEKGPTP